jgi:UDP-N-acetylmuramoyl-tripeptide--D-alanyl-D-alanine ligase
LVERPVADDLPQLVVDDSLAALRRVAARWRANFQGRVIGVTGSVGKTSTKEMLAALLGAEAFVTEANLNNLIGVPLMLLRVEPGLHRFAVIEAGMSVPGELGLSAAVIRPDLAIVTNVAAVHLEGVGSLAGIAREKATLVAELAPGGRAIIPAALLDWPEFAAQAARCIAVQFEGEAAPAVVPARLVRASFLTDARGQRSLVLDGEVFPLAPISDGLARNAALALVAALELGRPSGELAAVTAHWMPPAGRGSVHVEGERTFYVDCYNSSPASLLDSARAFDRVSRVTASPRLFLLGGMAELGPTSAQLHRDCGAQLPLRSGDLVVVFGGESAALLQGVALPGVELSVAASVEDAAARVAAHRGFVFLKGSRSFALERCLPDSLRSALSFH